MTVLTGNREKLDLGLRSRSGKRALWTATGLNGRNL